MNRLNKETESPILGEELERVTHFKYLVTRLEEEGGVETEITGW